MQENKILISGEYNVFEEGWNGCGVYMCSGLYRSPTFELPIYIGSSANLQERIEVSHLRYLTRNKHENSIFQYSWNKHAQKDGFVWWLLETCEPEKTLEIEQKYLDLYRPFKDECGGFNIAYNAKGGMIGRKHSEQTRKKISQSNMGKKHTEETKKHLSIIRKQNFASGKLVHPQLGKPISKKTRYALSQANLGKKRLEKYKPVRCITTEIIYQSVKDASKQTGFKQSGISAACIGIYKTCGGFKWEYYHEKDKLNNKYIRPPLKSKKIGEKHHCAKLNNKLVLEIREKYKTGNYTYHSLAKEYKVGKTLIGNIVERKAWINI